MNAQTIPLSQSAARRFLTQAFALDGVQTLPSVMEAVRTLEFVQEDSINICGRIHDLILWARVKNYAPSDLHAALYNSPREAFEYYFPNLCALPIEDYPYFVRAMQARQTGAKAWHALSDDEQIVARKLLTHLDEHGPQRTRKLDTSDGHTISGWGTRQSVAGRVMEKLWLQGHLMVARRENFERWFDRTDRLHPPALQMALPTEAEQAAHLTRKRFAARRFFRRPRPADFAILGGLSAFIRVNLENDPKPWFVLAEDADALHKAQSRPDTDEKPVHLLAPLDPLVYDRERLKSVWNFDYTWEVYTPRAKRKWGYYVLPILHGSDLIGRVDPQIDRKTGVLHLHSLRLEPEAQAKFVEIAAPLAARLHEFARFLGATRLDLGIVHPPEFRAFIAPLL